MMGPDDDEDFDEGEDPREARFRDAMAIHQERNTLLRSIHKANGILEEVTGGAPGYILEYLRDMQTQAIEATASIISKPTLTEVERIDALMKIQPYAHLMAWLKGRVAMVRNLEVKMEDLDRLLDGDGS